MSQSKDARAFANAKCKIGSFKEAQDITSQPVAIGFVPQGKILDECAAGLNGISHLSDAEILLKQLMERHSAGSVEAPQIAGTATHNKANSIS